MLDGRALGASQVEYQPFGKLPLKTKLAFPAAPPARYWSLIASTCRVDMLRHSGCATRPRQPTVPGLLAVCAICAIWYRSPDRSLCPALKPRQAAEPPQSPGFLLYVLYVLYLTPQLLAICTFCAILFCTRFIHVGDAMCIVYRLLYHIAHIAL